MFFCILRADPDTLERIKEKFIFAFSMNDNLRQLFKTVTGEDVVKTEQLTAAGSNRVYYRMETPARTLVGVEGTNSYENAAFLAIGRHLHEQGLPVPEILGVSSDCMCYLLQDLGNDSLFQNLDNTELLEKTIRLLPDIQFKGGSGLDFSVCFPTESFDRRSILWDLNYFKYCFLKATGLEFHEARLEDDFERLANILLSDAPYSTFMYRDFQARNVMVKGGNPWFIDFQGGRRGPIEYDLASFLWQARAAYPDTLKQHLIDVYLESLSRYRKVDPCEFRTGLMHFVLFRTLQVLGAYGYRGYFEHKPHFLQSIPAAMANLRTLLSVGANDYPYLTELLAKLVNLPQFEPQTQVDETDTRLQVRVMSFAYKKGLPQDTSGNGGGFVFDCRSIHNPGKYPEYKQLTGADEPVIRFLEEQGEVQKYLDSVYALTDAAVEKYIKRGFSNLMICFGCTGGQHRSLYCAEHTAAHIKEKFADSIHVVLEHRERKIRKEL